MTSRRPCGAGWAWSTLTSTWGTCLEKAPSATIRGTRTLGFEEFLAQGRAELDPARRRQIYQEADQLMLEDMPLIPCFCSNVHNLATSRLSGFDQLPYSNYGDQFANLKFT